MATKKKAAQKHKAVAKKPAPTKQIKAARRPAVNDSIGIDSIESLKERLESIKEAIEHYAAHMRPLDRRRLNGVGLKTQGFIERAYALAMENQEFLPHWLPMRKFGSDIEIFTLLRSLFDINRQISELVWNLVMQASDMAYTDALEFYSSAREAAKRRIDAAESIHEELMRFFSRSRRPGDEPTEAEIRRDINALLRGRKDGKIMIENLSPKTTGGARKLIDKTFKTKSAIKESAEAEIVD